MKDGSSKVPSATKISDLPIAYELAISYQENEINEASESTDVNIWTVMANGMYLIDTSSCFTPYGLVGVGFLDYDTDIDGDTVFAG